jgi:murein DD-endopeptidase MepM/ murein hydrolase activator NlpD
MRKLSILFLAIVASSVMTAQTIDVTAYSQNIALIESQNNHANMIYQIAAYPYISETYEIPAYGLYQKYWDTLNIRSKILEIPFSNDRLMLMLVQDANNPFVMPCQFEKIKTAYGETKSGGFHPGIDLKTEPQTLVKSCFDGVVRMSRNYGDYGFTVVVRHYNGLETVYAHLDKICVAPGQILKSGQVIGQTGTTGNTKECILHFETRFMNEYFDPELVIDFEEEDILQNNMALMSRDFNIIGLEETGSWKPSAPKPQPVTSDVKPDIKQETTQPKEKPQQVTEEKPQPKEENTIASQQPQKPQTEVITEDETSAVYHTVAAGENLYRISLKYNTTVDKILKLNNLKNADKIIEGQKIRVK